MTTSEKLIADCDRQIKELEAAKLLIAQHKDAFDQFGSGSIGIMGLPGFYLHEPPQNVKEFCRTIGTGWEKSSNGERIDYKLKKPFDICIFGAEQLQLSPLNL